MPGAGNVLTFSSLQMKGRYLRWDFAVERFQRPELVRLIIVVVSMWFNSSKEGVLLSGIQWISDCFFSRALCLPELEAAIVGA